MGVPIYLVAVAAPFFDPHEIALGNKVGDDLLCGTFTDADFVGDLANSDRVLARDTEEHVAVIREDEPARPLNGLGGFGGAGWGVVYEWLLNHGS